MRIIFSTLILLLCCSFATSISAQAGNNPCADLAKKHLKTLDQHLDLDFKQMKCLKEVATRFCSENKANPATSAEQRKNRLKKFRQAILNCLSTKQQEKVKSHFRDAKDKKARRNLLNAFMQEFGDEMIVLHKKS